MVGAFDNECSFFDDAIVIGDLRNTCDLKVIEDHPQLVSKSQTEYKIGLLWYNLT